MIIPKELEAAIPQSFTNRPFRNEEVGNYKINTWEKYFNDDQDFNIVVQQCDSPIAREKFSTVGSQQLTTSDLRQLFFVSMMWGYGNVGYGAHRTKKMLMTADVDQQLRSAVDCVAQGKIADAYRSLCLSWCGPAFMSKFLYASGLRLGVELLPVILDSMVARSLKNIMDNQKVDHRQYFKLDKKGMVQRFPEGYERFVHLINDWAATLGVPPDAIELYLFEMN